MKKISVLFLFVLVSQLMFVSCARRIYQVAYPTLSDGEYDSEFPYKNSSKELDKIADTVRKLNSIAYYQGYEFPEGSHLTKLDVENNAFKTKAVKEVYFNNSVIGTATMLNYTGRRIALLTCAHVVDFSDTLFSYFEQVEGEPQRYIQSVAFKKRQSNFVADLPEKGELEILAMDRSEDIALLGKTFAVQPGFEIPVFNYPFGEAKQLEWGSFVYLVGYPKGYQMVTKGIVSQPNRDKNGSFLVDALFNRGFSGGIVLAVRDGVPNFELVGIAGSVAADIEYRIVPPSDIDIQGFDPRMPYDGDVFIKYNKEIDYGITFITPMEEILQFLKDNEYSLIQRGYDLRELYPKQ
jgi:hypothetical protein